MVEVMIYNHSTIGSMIRNPGGMSPMLEDFINQANIKRNDYLLKTEELFIANKDKWFSDFAMHFLKLFTQIQKLQDDLVLSATMYMEYTMLYTNFINRHYTADIMIYGKKSYLDKNQRLAGSYNLSFLFVFFDKLWDDLMNLKRRYLGKVSVQNVTTYMMRILPDFYSYFANIARFALVNCFDRGSCADINKNEEFIVNIGDYMVQTETVYIENKLKNADKLTIWFKEQLWNEYVFGDYSSLDFSCNTFLYTDFRYARFQNSTLNYADFRGSWLTGANFRGAIMEGCCLDNCSLFEADFSNAILKKASFKNVRAKIGLSNKNEWQFVGFLAVSFRGADLTGADFTGSDLTGADFTGANLTSADFSRASLVGADFTIAVLTSVVFTDAITEGVKGMNTLITKPT